MTATPDASATGLRTLRAAGVAGLLFAVLMTSALVLIRQNQVTSADGSLQVGDAALVGLFLIPFAGIAFLWFLAVLRRRIGRDEDQFFATVFLGSGLLFIAMLFVAGATAGAALSIARLGSDRPTEDLFKFGRALSEALFYVFAIKMAAVFMIVSSSIGRRTGFLPRWLIVAGILAAVVMLASVGFFELLALIFPAWVAIVSILLVRARPESWSAS